MDSHLDPLQASPLQNFCFVSLTIVRVDKTNFTQSLVDPSSKKNIKKFAASTRNFSSQR